MRTSKLFAPTLRMAPADADAASHQLLVRAGFIRPLAAGIFSYLPLARRAMDRIEAILREEINAIGGQEMTMPLVHPADLWKNSGRWFAVGDELGRMRDRAGREMVLAMTHEEVVADLARREIRSYRQLPLLVYHIQTKWRDDPRPRAGLIRVREFTMLDSYSLDDGPEGLEAQYRAHYQAYFNIFHRCALPVVAVRADVGMMGGSLAHEYMAIADVGEDTLVICDRCGAMANRQVARFRKPPASNEPVRAMRKVATPGATTIDSLAVFLGIARERTAKAVFVMARIGTGEEEREELVFAIVRGDLEVNETKLANALGARDLRPATDEEIGRSGAVPGYASPVGLSGVTVVVDDSVRDATNLVAGANEEGYHLVDVNYGRDYRAKTVADIAAAREGDACIECGSPLRTARGVEVGNIFQLGTRFSEPLGCTVQGADGREKLIWMGSYGIGVGRLLACIAELHHDDAGLVWPVSVAPYPVHLVALAGGEEAAEALDASLRGSNLEPLFDDRAESAGVKFADADLVGLPLRLTVSRRSLQRGGAELKKRREGEGVIVGLEEAAGRVREAVDRLHAEIRRGVVVMPYRA